MKLRESAVIAALILVFFLAASGGVNAADWHVYEGESIQAAIDDASSGDTIYVHEGVYHEPGTEYEGEGKKSVIVNKDHLSIIGYDGMENVILDGQGDEFPQFFVPADYVEISGFTVRNDTQSCSSMGIVVNGSHCKISDNYVHHYKVCNVYIQGDYNIIENNLILDCFCGGCMSTLGIRGSNTTIRGNTIDEAVSSGLSIQIHDGGNNLIYNNRIYGRFVIGVAGNTWNTAYDCDGGPNILGGPCMGGNFYKGHTCVDIYSGPGQDQPGSDEICDEPYHIPDENGDPSGEIDYLPLKSKGGDLAITEIVLGWINFEERTYNITYTVKNIGVASVLSESSTSISVFDSGSVLQILVRPEPAPALEPGESYTKTVDRTFTMFGEVTATVCADAGWVISEENEENNCLQRLLPTQCGCETEDGTLYTCGDTVLKSCRLNGDMTCSGEDGLIIGTLEADLVVCIDGNGHSISGDGTMTGILAPDPFIPHTFEMLEIKGLEITNFDKGVWDFDTESVSSMRDCDVHHNNSTGTDFIGFVPGRNHGITDSQVHHNGEGILIGEGAGAVINGARVYENEATGIRIATTTSVFDCEIERNGEGIRAEGQLSAKRNKIAFNSGAGISVAANDCNISSNTIGRNGGDGIHISQGSEGLYLSRNALCFNDEVDFYVEPGCSGNFVENTCDTSEGCPECCDHSCSEGCVGNDTGLLYTCGHRLTESCTFTGDMACSTGHGLIIGADGITIDGKGHCLDGLDPLACYTRRVGIYNYDAVAEHGFDNMTVKYLEVKSFCNGIQISSNDATGRVQDNTIEFCDIHDNGTDNVFAPTPRPQAIAMYGVDNSAVKNNEIHDNKGVLGDGNPPGGVGIYLEGGNHNLFTRNTITDNDGMGVFIGMLSEHNEISRNYTSGNGFGGIGIMCAGSKLNTCEYNYSTGNMAWGIIVAGSSNTVQFNTCTGNLDCPDCPDIAGVAPGGFGIVLGENADLNTVDYTTACGNEGWDIGSVSGGTNSRDWCTCTTTGGEGWKRCRFRCNTLIDSDEDGVRDYACPSGCPEEDTRIDNCRLTANPKQHDTDGDRYGNICDCDLDNNDAVGPADFMCFRTAWGSTPGDINWNPDADFDVNGALGPTDFMIFRQRWGSSAPFE